VCQEPEIQTLVQVMIMILLPPSFPVSFRAILVVGDITLTSAFKCRFIFLTLQEVQR
jgi:energy-coupling factor transporter transmembrane protein EcfT